MPNDPFTDEIVGDGDFQAVAAKVQAGGIMEPDVKPLRPDALLDGNGQTL